VAASSLILVDVAPKLNTDGKDRIGEFMLSAPDGFATLDEAADAVAAYMPERPRPRSTNGLRKNLRHGADGRWRWHWDPDFLNGGVNLDTPTEDRLEQAALAVGCPIGLIRGGTSDIVTEAETQAFLTLLPHASYINIPRAGHMVVGDDNDAFSAAILQLLGSN
jgi:pimeloyl-ACP methyl ester carboxylesterase